MAGDVEGQRDLDSYHLGYLFQVVVDVVAHVSVGASLVSAGVLDDGQQVVGGVFGILIEDHLHFFRPLDYQLLTSLTTAVGDIAVFKVGLFQECHVNEAHATEIEAHQKHIAGEVK